MMPYNTVLVAAPPAATILGGQPTDMYGQYHHQMAAAAAQQQQTMAAAHQMAAYNPTPCPRLVATDNRLVTSDNRQCHYAIDPASMAAATQATPWTTNSQDESANWLAQQSQLQQQALHYCQQQQAQQAAAQQQAVAQQQAHQQHQAIQESIGLSQDGTVLLLPISAAAQVQQNHMQPQQYMDNRALQTYNNQMKIPTMNNGLTNGMTAAMTSGVANGMTNVMANGMSPAMAKAMTNHGLTTSAMPKASTAMAGWSLPIPQPPTQEQIRQQQKQATKTTYEKTVKTVYQKTVVDGNNISTIDPYNTQAVLRDLQDRIDTANEQAVAEQLDLNNNSVIPLGVSMPHQIGSTTHITTAPLISGAPLMTAAHHLNGSMINTNRQALQQHLINEQIQIQNQQNMVLLQEAAKAMYTESLNKSCGLSPLVIPAPIAQAPLYQQGQLRLLATLKRGIDQVHLANLKHHGVYTNGGLSPYKLALKKQRRNSSHSISSNGSDKDNGRNGKENGKCFRDNSEKKVYCYYKNGKVVCGGKYFEKRHIRMRSRIKQAVDKRESEAVIQQLQEEYAQMKNEYYELVKKAKQEFVEQVDNSFSALDGVMYAMDVILQRVAYFRRQQQRTEQAESAGDVVAANTLKNKPKSFISTSQPQTQHELNISFSKSDSPSNSTSISPDRSTNDKANSNRSNSMSDIKNILLGGVDDAEENQNIDGFVIFSRQAIHCQLPTAEDLRNIKKLSDL